MRERKKFVPRPPRVKKQRYLVMCSTYSSAVESANYYVALGYRTVIEGSSFRDAPGYQLHLW